jgi:hypothetical protein
MWKKVVDDHEFVIVILQYIDTEHGSSSASIALSLDAQHRV